MRRILLCLILALVLAALLVLALIAGASLTIGTMICVATWTAAAVLLGAVAGLEYLAHKLKIAKRGADDNC